MTKNPLPVQMPPAPTLPPVLSPILPTYTPAEPVQPEKSRGKLPLIIAIAVVLAIVAGASAFYYFYFIAASPERVVSQALDNLKNLQSGTINYQISFGYTPKEQPDAATAVTALGIMTAQNINFKVNSKTDFAQKADFVAVNTELALDFPTGMQIPMVGNLTISPIFDAVYADKENLYVKIKGLPVLPIFDLSSINDKWIKVNFKELQDQYGFKIDSSQTEQNIKKSAEWRDKTVAAYHKNSFMKLTKLGDETVDSENSFHFKLALDKELFKKFALQLNNEAVAEKVVTVSSTEQYLKDLDDSLKSVDLAGEVWIGKKTRIFKKVSVDLNVDDQGSTVKISQLLALTNYNKTVTITAPADSTSLKDVIAGIMGQAPATPLDSLNINGSGNFTAQDKAKAAGVLADVKKIQTALELYYNDNKKYPLSPIGGRVLGLNAVCLGKIGFGKKTADCQNPYLSNIPVSPDPIDPYEYYLCSDNRYVIGYYLIADVGNIKSGYKAVTPDGISDYFSTDLTAEKNTIPSITNDCQDPDQDGVPNFAEKKYGTDNLIPDTDGDGHLDGEEIMNGYNPLGPGKLK